jgi:hypothetical protein
MLVEARNTGNAVAGNPKRAGEGAPTLTGVHRFRNDWEKTASLALRDGDPAVIDTYDQHDRISEGTAAEMIDTAYAAWLHAVAAGGASVLVAEAATVVHDLNQRARADRILTGLTSAGRHVALTDGTAPRSATWLSPAATTAARPPPATRSTVGSFVTVTGGRSMRCTATDRSTYAAKERSSVPACCYQPTTSPSTSTSGTRSPPTVPRD